MVVDDDNLIKTKTLVPPTQGLCAHKCHDPLCEDPSVGCLNQPAYALRKLIKKGLSDQTVPIKEPVDGHVYDIHYESYTGVKIDATYTLWYMYPDMEFYHLVVVNMNQFSDELFDEVIEEVQRKHDVVLYTSNHSQYKQQHEQTRMGKIHVR